MPADMSAVPVLMLMATAGSHAHLWPRAAGLGLAGPGGHPPEQGSGGPTRTTDRVREGRFPEVKQDDIIRRGKAHADPSGCVSGVAFSGHNKTSLQSFQQKGLFTSVTRIPGLKQQLQDAFRLFLPLAPKSLACRPLSRPLIPCLPEDYSSPRPCVLVAGGKEREGPNGLILTRFLLLTLEEKPGPCIFISVFGIVIL